jgi:hypothetical protein
MRMAQDCAHQHRHRHQHNTNTTPTQHQHNTNTTPTQHQHRSSEVGSSLIPTSLKLKLIYCTYCRHRYSASGALSRSIATVISKAFSGTRLTEIVVRVTYCSSHRHRPIWSTRIRSGGAGPHNGERRVKVADGHMAVGLGRRPGFRRGRVDGRVGVVRVVLLRDSHISPVPGRCPSPYLDLDVDVGTGCPRCATGRYPAVHVWFVSASGRKCPTSLAVLYVSLYPTGLTRTTPLARVSLRLVADAPSHTISTRKRGGGHPLVSHDMLVS